MSDTVSVPSHHASAPLLAHLRQVAQQSPGIWPQLDRLRAARGKRLPQWPDFWPEEEPTP